MFTLMERCFGAQMDRWRPKLEQMVPSFGQSLNDNPRLLSEVTAETSKTLQLEP